MNYRIEGNELIIKGLFSEKRYDFRELTKVSFANAISIYKGDKCILKEKDMSKRVIYAMDIFHLAVKNELIFEDSGWFRDEIPVGDVYAYGMSVQEKIKQEYYDYVKQELGEEYELVVSMDTTPYHVTISVNVYRYGEKMYINDEQACEWCTVWKDGKKDIELHSFEVVWPTYINIREHKFKLTKLVDLQIELEEIKEQISLMKQGEIVAVSSLLKEN